MTEASLMVILIWFKRGLNYILIRFEIGMQCMHTSLTWPSSLNITPDLKRYYNNPNIIQIRKPAVIFASYERAKKRSLCLLLFLYPSSHIPLKLFVVVFKMNPRVFHKKNEVNRCMSPDLARCEKYQMLRLLQQYSTKMVALYARLEVPCD